jgi:glycosyltransferase involved in cell wall biosynthesis
MLKRHVTELRPHAAILWAMGGLSLSLVERLRRAEIPVLAVVADAWPAYGLDADAWTRAWRRRPRLGRAVDAATGMPTRFDHHGIHWLFISRYLADKARARLGLDPATVEVASPGIDRECFGPRREGSSWRWHLLYAGRFDGVKGIDVAVDALGELPPAATLTLDGDGDPAVIRDLRTQSEALGLNGRVRFTRSSSQTVARAYADADVVLFPVRWEEPWGLVPLEAMAVGVPVVSTRLGGCAEYLRDGENCLVVPPDDAGALAAAVRRLAHEPELRARLRAGGLATAARYPAQAFFDAVISAVERLARRDSGAR